MKKPKLCCYLTWIVLIELYFTVAFLLFQSCISVNRKTWEDRFAGKVGGWGILRNGENLRMGRISNMVLILESENQLGFC